MDICVKCDQLVKCRTQIVYPTQSFGSEILAIGEAPGVEEDTLGKGFVGISGKNLDGLFNRINIAKDSYNKANILRCRPPNNRKPTTKEIDSCLPYLLEFIITIKPKIILTVGSTAASIFCGKMPLSHIIKHQQQNYFRSNLYKESIHPLIQNTINITKYFISIPHTSPLAFNRSNKDGIKWKEVSFQQIQFLNDLIKE